MFEIVSTTELQNKIKNLQGYYPPEACQEINHFLEILKQDGHLSKTNFYDINTNEIAGLYCNLFYKPYLEEKKVLLIDIKMKAADIFKQRFTIEDDWDDNICVDSIPQYDKPKKIIEAILLIYQGITDSYELGYKLGNRGKKDVYISRHGQYAKQALEALKLITRMRQGNKWLTELTQKGRLIAEAPNEDLQVRLLIEAMLSYPPVWRIIDAVSLKQSQLNSVLVLNDEVVKELTFPEVLKDADTSNRRSQTLKNWIKWISKKSGIPIRIHEEGVQLTIPMLFAEVLDGADTD
ncbi:MAG: hypothetical protein RMY64_33305 [Nostoc sp. DedQUE08]|uniref:DUF7226 domain-containing protein n=1 Tax=Nostoc sp. DedQUE08 TaxID=3075393 RepID=UPI002AD44EF5|nr:hypothetical protein [Nostoc sp. DedQUE08]MDZ8070434.1 hypothetical protein [Nostoc sp. DedQUE08]